MNNVDNYILRQDFEAQHRLMLIRSIIQDLIPGAHERLYYAIPTISINGKDALHYAAYKKHISLIVGYDFVEYLMKHFPQYQYTRATVKFPHKDDFPIDFIEEVCKMIFCKLNDSP